MRILKFAGVFFGTLLLIFLIVFGFNLDALNTLYENSEDLQEGQEWVSKTSSLKGLTEYIGAHPDRMAVVSRSAINPDTTITLSENEPRTMGTLSNFFLIATYARLVENDSLDPNKLVSIDEIDRYQLPYIDASHHQDAKTALENQELFNSDNQIPLQNLVQKAIVYNDLAISDYLYNKLGEDSIKKTYELIEVERTDLPLPFAGLYITLHPKLNATTFESHFNRLQQMPETAFRDSVLAAQNRYLNDQSFHDKVNSVFEEQQGLGVGFVERRDLLTLFPKSTANELSRLMIQLQQDSLISPEVSGRIREIMNWPYQEQSLNNDFEYYGAIYDNRLGLLNGIDYGASTYSAEPFGQAIFFDSLQVAFWFHMSSTFMHQDYQQRLMWDPALRTATLQQINK